MRSLAAFIGYFFTSSTVLAGKSTSAPPVRCDLEGGGWYRLDFDDNHHSAGLFVQMCDVVNQRIRECREEKGECLDQRNRCIDQRADCDENAREIAAQALVLLIRLIQESGERRDAESALNEVCRLLGEADDEAIPTELREAIESAAGCEKESGLRKPLELRPSKFKIPEGLQIDRKDLIKSLKIRQDKSEKEE